jgi:MFS superfamily sulfate permease-like transporter
MIIFHNLSPLSDVISGVIMAATSIPQLIAYAETVGYAGYRGLATAGPPLMAWGGVTGSVYMNAGVTSLTAIMAKSDLNSEAYVAEHGEAAYVELVAAYSLYIGIASIVLALVGFGKVAKSVPKPVRFGFKWGCSLGVLVSAVPNGFFVHAKVLKQLVIDSVWYDLVAPYGPAAINVTNFLYALSHPWAWSLEPTILFVGGTLFVIEGKKYLPKFLPPGSEVILVTLVATLYSMYFDYPGSVVGEIPPLDSNAGISLFGGLLYLPVEFMDVKKLVMEVPLVDSFGGSWPMLALSATLYAAVNFLSIMGIASGFESEDGIPWNAQRELIAQGVSCGVAAAVGSAPVSGSLSRSLVSRMTGTTSQLACIVTALCWIYMQPYMSIMSPTPKAALSAVIVSAVLKGVAIPKDLIKLTGLDFVVGWSTGIVTAVTSPTQGFGIGLVLYFVLSIFRSTPKEPKTKAE